MEKATKITQPLFLIVLIIALLIILKDFLIPLSYGLLISLIIYPVCKKLENKKVPRSLAIFISILIVTLILCGLIFIIRLDPALVCRLFPNIKWNPRQICQKQKLLIQMTTTLTSRIRRPVEAQIEVATKCN